MSDSIKSIIMRREGLDADEADELIAEARQAIQEGDDPEEVLVEFFGLEPDYIFDLLG